MKIIIETERLILREFELNDAKDFYKMNLDNEVLQYTGDDPFNSIKEAEEFIRKYKYENGLGRFAIILKNTNGFIGFCGFKKNEEDQIDIGFRIIKKYWGIGFASEAAKACLKYGFNDLKLKKIIGRAHQLNIASHKVLRKIGMSFWKKAPAHGLEEAVYFKINNPEIV